MDQDSLFILHVYIDQPLMFCMKHAVYTCADLVLLLFCMYTLNWFPSVSHTEGVVTFLNFLSTCVCETWVKI
jgi:hypothetical protein